MKLRSRLILFVLMFVSQAVYAGYRYGNKAPAVGDAAEVHNIAWNLARGQGYRFDWDDAGWRGLWLEQNFRGRLDFVINRHGSYPTMFRPPLMPVIVAGLLKVVPSHSFIAWRLFDAAAFAVGACFLCEVAFVFGQCAGLAVMIVVLLADPLRMAFVPGWWTEGIAFDFVAVTVWLLANARALRPWVYALSAGFSLGLLCLDRSVFVPLLPFLCVLLAIARTGKPFHRISCGLAILAVSILIQLPWWVRNIEVSGRMMPLGTQGGFNLPDQYGPAAVDNHGVWTGRGLRDALTPPGSAIPLPPGYTEQTFTSLWIPPDRSFDVMIDRSVCTSLASEIEVSDIGTRAAKNWLRSNYRLIPTLMVEKVWMQSRYGRLPISAAVLIGCAGFYLSRNQRRLILLQAGLITLYVLAIAMTHVVFARFLVPILPPFYVMTALGIAAMWRRFRTRLTRS